MAWLYEFYNVRVMGPITIHDEPILYKYSRGGFRGFRDDQAAVGSSIVPMSLWLNPTPVPARISQLALLREREKIGTATPCKSI